MLWSPYLIVLLVVKETSIIKLTFYNMLFIDDVDYVPVGCYKDVMSDRALPELLENYRIKTKKYPDVLKWKDLENSVIERCAVKVCLIW